MNSWISSELKKIDIKTKKIERSTHSRVYAHIKPELYKLINYNSSRKDTIHDLQQIYESIIKNHYDNLTEESLYEKDNGYDTNFLYDEDEYY